MLDLIRQPPPKMKVMLVVAHPDDEVIGVGSRLGWFAHLMLVHVTDGAPANMTDATQYGFGTRQEYARARREELNCALAEARATPELVELGVPDQEATNNIPAIAQHIRELAQRFKPDLILTHPYEGGHPDHDACACAVQLAGPRVPRCEFASYHAKDGCFHCSDFLPGYNGEVLTIELDSAQRQQKARMIACFRTQQRTLAGFGTELERYRHAPVYDFTQPPHPGTLYYEMFPWGMTGERFREMAGKACL